MLQILIVLSLLLTFYLIMIMPNFLRRKEMKPFLQRDYAHRGLHSADKLIPENSMAAFREALNNNLAIELDIHLTRDNQIVVFHDETLDRICHVPGTIENSSVTIQNHPYSKMKSGWPEIAFLIAS